MSVKYKNIVYDQWLADILKREAYQLVVDNDLIEKASEPTSEEYNLLRDLQSKPVFIYSKVSTEALSAVRFLEGQGFNLIDTNVIFDKPIVPEQDFSGYCNVRFAVPEDQNQVVELSRKSFAYSRFYLDSAFPREVADAIKAEWVKGYFTGNRGDTMVGLADEKIVGFLLLLYGGEGTLIIDLIATDEKYRRRGVAKGMIAYAESQCHGFSRIRVGTQLANVPSMRLYEEIGFKIAEAQYTFHFHHG